MSDEIRKQPAAAEMSGEEFRKQGVAMVNAIAELLDTIGERKLTPGKSVSEIRSLLPAALSANGEESPEWLERWTKTIVDNSLYNGHPRFWGFITSSASPVGALGDLLGAAINPNLGGWLLSPIATEIEIQVIKWIADFVGYSDLGGGLLVSGGNMANMVGFWAARRKKATWDIRKEGISGGKRMTAYVSAETHTWIEKAADLSGLGTHSIRWIPTDEHMKMRIDLLRESIIEDIALGNIPFLVVGTAGSVSRGVVDPMEDLSQLCTEYDLWFHIDGAYGAPASSIDGVPTDLKKLHLADSIAVDPHKWLYAPIEAGAILVKNAHDLRDTFSYHPPYYPDLETGDDAPTMFHEFGPQNSRGFRALKVWLSFMQIGSTGMRTMIEDDIKLAQYMYELAEEHPDIEAKSCHLSITTLRYLPDLSAIPEKDQSDYVNRVNKEALELIQEEGDFFLTHALFDDDYFLRACIVNFRTRMSDVRAFFPKLVEFGEAVALRHKQKY